MDLSPLLQPRSIAIVGASGRTGSFGQRLLTSITGWRYRGAIYPVNPGYDTLDGLRCYPDLASLPEVPDCAAFAVSDDRIEQALTTAAAAGVRAAMLYGRGWEPPETGRTPLPDRLGAIARAAGMAVCGNNCMGFISMPEGLRMSANPPPLPDEPGCVGLISHSGSTWSGLVGNQRDLRYNYAISAGQEIASGLADYLEFLLAQPSTRVIACVIETVRHPEPFLAALEAADRQGIPVVALKLGRSEAGQRFALAHSGALSGSDAAYRAVFERRNVIRVTTPDELTDTVEMLSCSRRPPPSGRGLGMVTNSGGERQLVVDLATDLDCPITQISPATTSALEQILDPGMSPVNPVDSFGDGRMLVGECMDALAKDDGVGVVCLLSNMVYGRATARNEGAAVEAVSHHTDKPVAILGNLHSAMCRDELARLRALGIPVLMGTVTALSALRSYLVWHHREPPAPAPTPPPAALLQRWRHTLAAADAAPLAAADALALLADFGIPAVSTIPVQDEPGLIDAAAAATGFPAVLKTAAPEVLHKSDQGGVMLNIRNQDALRHAYRQMAEKFGPACILQQQLEPGVEILLGMTNDATFGPMMTVALGGIFTEVFRDAVTVQPPVSTAEAHRIVRRLKGYALLQGARGTAPVDLDALARSVAAFSTLCAALGPSIQEMDVNPVLASARGTVAVDALVIPRPGKP